MVHRQMRLSLGPQLVVVLGFEDLSAQAAEALHRANAMRIGSGDFELPNEREVLRAVYAATTAEVEAIERGLEAVSGCDLRIVLLHYAPTASTLAGERQAIWPFLGSHRLAAPIARFRPDLVLHGHAYGGHLQGTIEGVPVLNVAVPVLGEEFALVGLEANGEGWEVRYGVSR
jgi:Icc-related predicted phosphoesterase